MGKFITFLILFFGMMLSGQISGFMIFVALFVSYGFADFLFHKAVH